MHEGERIYVTDGKGHRFECLILEAHPKHTQIEIIRTEEIPPWWNFHIDLCIAPSKSIDRMEWLVEKAVEIGVDRIVLLKCGRSERKTLRKERLEKIAISAMNQSLKTNLPQITDPIEFKTIVAEDFEGYKCFGYCDATLPRVSFAQEYHGGNLRIMIGPEGDFTPQEVSLAISAGYRAVTFGKSRLRLETAALYAAVAAHVVDDITEDR